MGKVVPAGWGWGWGPTPELRATCHLTHLEYGKAGLGDNRGVWCGSCTGLTRVTLVNGDDLEGRQVQVGEAGILQVVEVPLRQGVPAPSAPACHLGQAGPPHTLQCPLQPRCHCPPGAGEGGGGKASSQVSRCTGPPYRRPLSCAFRLCSNRAASLKDTRRPVELVDKKRWVSVS